ncbi:MAG TPA: class I SAM-dependent methyltransferase [bacterium]|nr:class I SAM-dependent methyltransferase [bacterium]
MSREETIIRARAELRALYRDLGYGSFYCAVREALCPFFFIEEHLPRTGTIVDIGCGYGLMANIIRLMGGDERTVFGVDLSAYRIGKAQATVRAGDSRLQFICSDIRTAQLPPADGVTMIDFLHHIPFALQEEVLAQLPRILAPDGVVVIKEFADRPRWKYWATLLFEAVFYPNDKLTYRPVPEWQAMLEKLGFAVTLHEEHRGSFVPSVMLIATRTRVAG